MWEWMRQMAGSLGQSAATMAQHAELLARYKQLRRAGLELNNRLVKLLSKSVLEEGGKKLGILKKNILVLDTEDEIALLMDYCIHDVRRQGLTAVERYLAASPPPPGSDEVVLLQALGQARYGLFVVEAVERRMGVQVRDLLRDESLFLIDVGLSHTATIGLILAGRVFAAEGINMTTGASLPVGVLSAVQCSQFLQGLKTIVPTEDFRHMSAEQASELNASIIRKCLKQGAAERIRYVE